MNDAGWRRNILPRHLEQAFSDSVVSLLLYNAVILSENYGKGIIIGKGTTVGCKDKLDIHVYKGGVEISAND